MNVVLTRRLGRRSRIWRRSAFAVAAAAMATLLFAAPANAKKAEWTTVSKDFASPLFGLTRSGGGFVVADAGAGPTRLNRDRSTSVIAQLPGVTDVLPIGHGWMLATTSHEFGPTNALYRISPSGQVTQVADLLAFEEANDPDQDGVETDPFDLARTKGGKTLVADAAANDILVVDNDGNVDWVATLPEKRVSTAFAKELVGCPNPANPDDEFFCTLPRKFSADPVPDTVAVGPDGTIYVGELRGIPATPRTSRVWAIKPGTRHAHCGDSNACRIVAKGFTSIIDIVFGPNGKAYVLELDEKSWLAATAGLGVGGTVNVCSVHSDEWDCHKRQSGLPFPTALAFRNGRTFSTLFSVVPGEAQVARLH